MRFVRPAVSAVILLAALCATPAFAEQSDFAWIKGGSNGDATQVDLEACMKQAKAMHGDYQMSPAVQSMAVQRGVGGVIGATIGTAIAAKMADDKAQAVFIRACMRTQGYARVDLTEPEIVAFRSNKDRVYRVDFMQRIYDARDFAQRLAQATRPVAPLPMAAEDIQGVGPYHFDPAALVAVTGEVSRGTVLSGPITRRATAKLATTVPHTSSHTDVREGTPFIEVPTTGADGKPRTYWCWFTRFGAGHTEHCVRDEAGAYSNTQTLTVANTIVDPSLWPDMGPVFNDSDFVLTASAQDLFPPVVFDLSIRRVNDHEVTLIATTTSESRKFPFWVQTIAFDAGGKVVVPFWTHRLVLTRTPGGVAVAYTPDGDGHPLPPNDTAQFHDMLTY